MTIHIRLASVMVDDQDEALSFYTRVMGFEAKNDIPMGEHRWLTVVNPANPEVELLLEPMAFPPARTFQKALYEAGIPCTAMPVDDIVAEVDRMVGAGAVFRTRPDPGKTTPGPMTAMVEDGCGNLIQLFQA